MAAAALVPRKSRRCMVELPRKLVLAISSQRWLLAAIRRDLDRRGLPEQRLFSGRTALSSPHVNRHGDGRADSPLTSQRGARQDSGLCRFQQFGDSATSISTRSYHETSKRHSRGPETPEPAEEPLVRGLVGVGGRRFVGGGGLDEHAGAGCRGGGGVFRRHLSSAASRSASRCWARSSTSYEKFFLCLNVFIALAGWPTR